MVDERLEESEERDTVPPPAPGSGERECVFLPRHAVAEITTDDDVQRAQWLTRDVCGDLGMDSAVTERTAALVGELAASMRRLRVSGRLRLASEAGARRALSVIASLEDEEESGEFRTTFRPAAIEARQPSDGHESWPSRAIVRCEGEE